MKHSNLIDSFNDQTIIKLISGITNFNTKRTLEIIEAGELGGASYIDIAADVNMIRQIRLKTNFPICISTINSYKINACIDEGVDMVEIGNFDFLYNKNQKLNTYQILQLCQDVRNQFPNLLLCATVPHVLSLSNQIGLAKAYESIGIDLIQTEGKKFGTNLSSNIAINERLKEVSLTLSTTLAISNSVKLPVITSSGLSNVTAPLAIRYGASGVGIGSAITTHKNIDEMSIAIKNLKLNLLKQLNSSRIENRSSIEYYQTEVSKDVVINNLQINSIL